MLLIPGAGGGEIVLSGRPGALGPAGNIWAILGPHATWSSLRCACRGEEGILLTLVEDVAVGPEVRDYARMVIPHNRAVREYLAQHDRRIGWASRQARDARDGGWVVNVVAYRRARRDGGRVAAASSARDLDKRIRAMMFADNHVEYDITECHISLVASVAEDIGLRTAGLRYFLDNLEACRRALLAREAAGEQYGGKRLFSQLLNKRTEGVVARTTYDLRALAARSPGLWWMERVWEELLQARGPVAAEVARRLHLDTAEWAHRNEVALALQALETAVMLATIRNLCAGQPLVSMAWIHDAVLVHRRVDGRWVQAAFADSLAAHGLRGVVLKVKDLAEVRQQALEALELAREQP